ncbi:MAG: helix-turn-helix domain-containing protein, partial [Clostridia bacterium]
MGDDVDAAEAGPDVSRGPVSRRTQRRVCLVSSAVELVSLPPRLRAARRAVGLARAAVARALRIPVSRLDRWERGQTRVPLSVVL